VHLRCELEWRQHSALPRPAWNSFYEELAFLKEIGLDFTHNPDWGSLRRMRTMYVHPSKDDFDRNWFSELRNLSARFEAPRTTLQRLIP
jgi:hypothetical protein